MMLLVQQAIRSVRSLCITMLNLLLPRSSSSACLDTRVLAMALQSLDLARSGEGSGPTVLMSTCW